MNIRCHLKRLHDEPREETRSEVIRLRQALSSDLLLLQSVVPSSEDFQPNESHKSVQLGDSFDHLDDDHQHQEKASDTRD